MTPEVHLTRALNAARRAHKPTYAGLRALIGDRSDGRRLKWASALSDRKLLTRRDWRYYEFPILKEIEEDGQPAYRKYTIGSPMTILAEASLLAEMANEKAFAVPENVYSYLWPRTARSGHNFQFYQHGYARRNAAIRQLLVDNPSHVAWISDIRQFYPSVNWSLLQPKLNRRIRATSTSKLRDSVANFASGIEAASPSGIAIGPDFAHVLANIALEEVDTRLAAIFGRHYFRYVDDIVIVCPSNAVQVVADIVDESLWFSGFEAHDGKTDYVNSTAWIEECPQVGVGLRSGTFEELIQELSVYLALRPDSLLPLQELFGAEGVSLPFERLVAQSKYDRFQKYVWGAIKNGHFWSTTKLYLRREIRFVEQAKEVRSSLFANLQTLLGSRAAKRGMRRRWFVQKTRYCLNRLLYLFPRHELKLLEEWVPEGQEFAEYRVLLRALVSGDATPLLRYPGRLIATFCELNAAAPMGTVVLRNLEPVPYEDWAVAESLASLALYFGSESNINTGEFRFPGGRILLEICQRNEVNKDEITSMTYLDEMEALMRGMTKEQLLHLSRTRFSGGESIGLEGLLMGGGYGLS